MLVQDSPTRGSAVAESPIAGDSPELVPELVRRWAVTTPTAPALEAPGGRALSYAALDRTLDALVGDLRAGGVAPGSRVACVVEDGPATALLVLALMRGGSCAPLNPAYRRRELELYLRDLRADAIVIGSGSRAMRGMSRARSAFQPFASSAPSAMIWW